MTIDDRVDDLAARVRKHKAGIETEEATKNAFVMPFISSVLGYDVFDPAEVIPEFTADTLGKRGEKIDYAVVHGGQVQILVEAKKVTEPLRVQHSSQLFRYFSVTNARIAILTNGEVYEFYTDLDKPNIMDEKPFLVLDLSAIDPTLLPELDKLTKDGFDLDTVINAAGELKYVGQLKRILAAEFKNPSSEWVTFLAKRVYEKYFSPKVREQFEPLVAKAAAQFLTEQVNDRLSTALGGSTAAGGTGVEAAVPPADETAGSPDHAGEPSTVITTDEELDGFRIVQAIVCSEVPAARIAARDGQSYFAILLDDNNRKPIARLWFNRAKKYLGTFDENKIETRVPVATPQDIYAHADRLRATVAAYVARETPVGQVS